MTSTTSAAISISSPLSIRPKKCTDRGISGRTLSKIRLGERGVGGAVDQLVRLGAPAPGPERLENWLARLVRERILLRRHHPGLYTYWFEISREARRPGRPLPRLAYPLVLYEPHPELPP